jgi:nucleotide-binding universal stress UspA family protein
MRRVLVPLDGSEFAEAIIPDARRLAGTDGELILVREASWPILQRDIFVDASMLAVEDAEWYLEHEAEKLRADGVSVRTQSLIMANAAAAIDSAVKIFNADMIAIATHGRGPLGRLAHGSTAWRALAHSTVPILLRHVENAAPSHVIREVKRRIMVPLDGSTYAEKALPAAQELALEWNAPIWLVQVVPDYPITDTPYARVDFIADAYKGAVNEAQKYLEGVAASLHCDVHCQADVGAVSDILVGYVERFSITDVVMASHGRTGLSRVILGSIADDLLHRLHTPIIVIPVLATGRLEEQPGTDRPYAAVGAPSGEQGAS